MNKWMNEWMNDWWMNEVYSSSDIRVYQNEKSKPC